MSIKLRPSKANQWMACPGSAKMQEPFIIKQESTDAAEEGTAAHWVASEMLKGNPLSTVAPNGIIIDSDMISYAEEYCEELKDWNNLNVERKLVIPIIDNEGTLDVNNTDYNTHIIKIRDYKYGFTPVEVEKNWQLICYVDGIINILDKNGKPCDIDEWIFELSIHQPRAYHPEGKLRTITYTYSELKPLFDELEAGAKLAMSSNPPLKTGSQCTYCAARHVCTTLQQSGYIAVELSQQASPLELNLDQAGRELLQIELAIDILKARKTGLESQIEFDILMKGGVSPHYTVERVKSREKWQEGKEHLVIALGEMLGVNLAAPVKALTPVQCRKLKVDNDIIKQYSVIPIGENKLVKRNTNLSKKLFGK